MLDYRQRVRDLENFNDAFELVKAAVYEKFKMRRAGLNLVLQDMPSFIGAYHVMGTNSIVVNRHILAAIKALAKSREEYNSYLFVVLSHEYLHSLGIVDEHRVRELTYDVCNSLLGEAHVATKMARTDPSSLYPELKNLAIERFGADFELIKDFDKSNLSYIA
ncbi:MAG: hypothetical protein ACE5JV_01665 [Nitrososphaerales archaeon]